MYRQGVAAKLDPPKPGETWWTGYPFKELGDPEYQPAPVRPVTIIEPGYDGNKYVDVRLENGVESSLKAGYLFPSQELAEEFERSCRGGR